MCDLEAENEDGRNLWSIVGLAHEDAGLPYRKYVNPEIKEMVRELGRRKLLKPRGLATSSTANRGKRLREEDHHTEPVMLLPAASSSSRHDDAASSSDEQVFNVRHLS